MKFPRSPRPLVAPLLTVALCVSLALAQQPKPAPTRASSAPKPAANAAEQPAADVTLDTLFAADSYAVYGEMRGVGQYVSSEDFKQMLGPLRLPGSIPPELDQLLDFITSHAEILSNARLAFAAMAARDGLPDVVAAVELTSSEDARKLEPQLREFIADNYGAQSNDDGTAAKATTTAGATKRSATLGAPVAVADEGGGSRAARRRARLQSQPARTLRASEKVEAQGAAPPVFIRRAGSLVVMADKQFTFRRLRGAAGARSLLDEPGFQAARARLSSDTLFLYFNTTRMSRSTKRQMDEYERQRKLAEEEAEESRIKGESYDRTITSSVGGTTHIVVSNSNMSPGASVGSTATNSNLSAAPPTEEMSPDRIAEVEAVLEEHKANAAASRRLAEEVEEKLRSQPGYAEEQKRREQQREFERQFQRLVFDDSAAGSSWAESIGVGASMQGDEIVVRALFVGDAAGSAPRPVPFMPILLSGPQVASEAASVVPADADIFATASLDLPQMYEYVASVFKIFDLAATAAGEQDKLGLFESQISAFERDNKFRIREDLLGALGNEIAVVMPPEMLGVRRQRRAPKGASNDVSKDAGTGAGASGAAASAQEPQTFAASPVVIVSLADKEAMKALLPRALAAVGITGVSEQQLIEKRGDVEILTFTQASAAFVGNFLVMSDPQTMRWVIDAYNRRETLANSDEFRRAAGWQQRQLLGQVYVSNALFKDHFDDVYKSIDDIDDQELRTFLARLDANPGAVTHSLTKEGDGLLHELHVPKNLLTLMSASAVVARQLAPQRSNEARATYALYQLASAEHEAKGKGGYVSLEELKNSKRLEEMPGLEGYEIRLTASGDHFEITATPTDYPKQGRRSFFVDETNVLRGADTGGKAATASTEPVNR